MSENLPERPVARPTPADYNPFFELLVERTDQDTPDRLIGMLAYARYKSIKCEWTKKYRHANGGAWPVRETVQTFLDAHSGEMSLQGLRAEAEKQLYTFGEWYADQQIRAVREQMRADVISESLNAHKATILAEIKSGLSAPRAILINVASSLIFAALLLTVAWIASNQTGPLFPNQTQPAEAAPVVEHATPAQGP